MPGKKFWDFSRTCVAAFHHFCLGRNSNTKSELILAKSHDYFHEFILKKKLEFFIGHTPLLLPRSYCKTVPKLVFAAILNFGEGKT